MQIWLHSCLEIYLLVCSFSRAFQPKPIWRRSYITLNRRQYAPANPICQIGLGACISFLASSGVGSLNVVILRAHPNESAISTAEMQATTPFTTLGWSLLPSSSGFGGNHICLVSNNISRPVCKELNREVAQRHSRGSGYEGTSKYRQDCLPVCNKRPTFQLSSLLFFYISPSPTETPLEHFKSSILRCTQYLYFPFRCKFVLHYDVCIFFFFSSDEPGGCAKLLKCL